MAETHGFLRVLPDSTGKRLPQVVMVEIDYNNGTIPFLIGDIITTGTSNIICTVFEKTGTTSAGSLHVKIEEPVPQNLVFTIGENLIVNSTIYAKASTVGIPFYYPINTISGYNNPINGWDIQNDGSGLMSFPEGAPIFDAFGKMLIAEQTTMAEYLNKYQVNLDTMANILVGTASITHDPFTSGIVLSTGTLSGDKAERISHQYHPYQLGKSRLIEMTCAVGDTGKANVNRHWGYADNSDGLLFSLMGTTLNVQLRSSVTGSVVKTYIPQSQWNGDRLDGSGGVFNESKILLDVSKGNIYWIDFQWLGVGRVRFGIVGPNGKRVICHTIENANANNRTYMRTGSLPVYLEQVNSGVPASSSEFRSWCIVVKNGGVFSPTRYFYGIPSITKTITSSTEFKPIISFRAKQYLNNISNRMNSFLDYLNVVPVGGSIELKIMHDVTLSGASWTGDSGNSIEYDSTSTSLSGGNHISTFYIENNKPMNADLSKVFNFMGHAIRRHADNNTAITVTVAAKLLSAGSSDVNLSATFSDV